MLFFVGNDVNFGFNSLNLLSINDTKIEDLEEFHSLSQLPIKELRAQRNLLADSKGVSIVRLWIIGALERLTVLNSSEIKNRERFLFSFKIYFIF